MHVEAIDHLNLRIPRDRIDEAVGFYGEALGFAVENRTLYEEGEKPFFSFRVNPDSVIHVQPVDEFEAPSGGNFAHVALRFEEDVGAIRDRLATNGIAVDRERRPLGATGVAPAVYVTDPFGYTLELKAGD